VKGIFENYKSSSQIGRFITSSRFIRLLLLCFFTVLILLVSQVLLNTRDFNDEWILSGIFEYFLLLILVYSFIVSFSSNLKLITGVTSIFLVAINLIPNLKYVFIYGTFDPLAHYGFIQQMISSGHVPQVGVYKDLYGPTPGLHIFVSTLSMVSGFSVSMSMKAFLTIFPLILPLAVYLVAKRLNMPKGLSKLAVISTAVTSPTTYIFGGTSATYFLYVFFLYFLLLSISHKEFTRRDLLVSIVFGLAILFSHSPTSFFLLFSLVVASVAFILLKAMRPSAKLQPSSFMIMWIVVYLAYFVYVSDFDFLIFLQLSKTLMTRLLSGQEPLTVGYYRGFYELALHDQAKVLIVMFGRDAVAGLLSILALVVMFRLKFKDNNLRRFYYVLVLFSFLASCMFLLYLFIRPIGFVISRGLGYFLALSPFLVGLTLYFVQRRCHQFSRLILAFTVFALICVSILQTYPYQPLIPIISTEYGDRYVMDYRQSNSIFQRALIHFVSTHNNQLDIATDDLTRWQMYGLTDPYYQYLISWETPGITKEMHASLTLISPNARANPMATGKNAVIYERYVREALQTRNLIYMNGESYIFLNK